MLMRTKRSGPPARRNSRAGRDVNEVQRPVGHVLGRLERRHLQRLHVDASAFELLQAPKGLALEGSMLALCHVFDQFRVRLPVMIRPGPGRGGLSLTSFGSMASTVQPLARKTVNVRMVRQSPPRVWFVSESKGVLAGLDTAELIEIGLGASTLKTARNSSSASTHRTGMHRWCISERLLTRGASAPRL